ncbi:hypothetical protein HRbin01_01611 [archaeon HR01]|nr:hypothetical protein HRbin01_01611 [archaeon HR01]
MAGAVINAYLPKDNSLANLLIYEGLIFLLSRTPHNIDSPSTITVNPEALREVYENLDNGRIEMVNIAMAGKNDTGPVQKFLRKLKIKATKKITMYNVLLELLNKKASSLPTLDTLQLTLSIRKKFVALGSFESKDDGFSIQLFKAERYTGLTSTELKFTTEQLTTYLSAELLLIGLLGIYSSFVARVFEKSQYYYFLFFDAGEINQILNDPIDLATLLSLKNDVRDEIQRIVEKHYSEELLLTDLMVNVRLQRKLAQSNRSMISLHLVRVALEGQAYKVYQHLPLKIYRRGDNMAYEFLSRLLDPDGPILERLRNRNNPEHSNLLQVVYGTYRYVTLDDEYGLYIALRELLNAAAKLDEKKKNESFLKRRYLSLASEFRRVMVLD